MYWEEAVECMDRKELKRRQWEKLQISLARAYQKVPFYRQQFETRGLSPADIRGLEDLQRLPFTEKGVLRDHYPFGMFAVPQEEVVRVHASSGTTGKPTVVGYTRGDLEVWADLMARALTMAGATTSSVVQVAYGYGLFTGGLGVHYGVERLGAIAVPASGGNTPRQIMLMEDFGTNILACTPSYALYLAEVIEEMGIERSRLALEAGVFGAEPWTNQMRQSLESRLQIKALDIYGLSEIMGPGVAMECPHQTGLHFFEDHFLPEIIDPDTGETLPYGEKGELVITTLTKEALPMLRYRTRDIAVLHPEPCSCGRTLVRLEKILGRTDDMVIIRGVNVFPSQVETVLLRAQEVAPFYELIIDRKGSLDILEVRVEVTECTLQTAEIKELERIRSRIKRDLDSTLGIAVEVRLVEPRTIGRTEGKAKRVIDRRTER
ncbi:MAG: phenylacetate--CoA ligase [Syntrophomonadaceae bacterium]|nr:phenylacetate--CoA ligase [Syntrophomonadaceae bacterium]